MLVEGEMNYWMKYAGIGIVIVVFFWLLRYEPIDSMPNMFLDRWLGSVVIIKNGIPHRVPLD